MAPRVSPHRISARISAPGDVSPGCERAYIRTGPTGVPAHPLSNGLAVLTSGSPTPAPTPAPGQLTDFRADQLTNSRIYQLTDSCAGQLADFRANQLTDSQPD